MTTTLARFDVAPAPMGGVNLARCYWIEAVNECRRLLRTPMFAVPTLAFPALFYLLFAVVMNRGGGPEIAALMLDGYLVFGVMGPGLFGFGVAVAVDRDQGWLRLRQALPLPPGAYLFARLATALLFSVLVFASLAAVAVFAGGVELPLARWAGIFAVLVPGVLPFCAIGLWIGTLASGQAAPAIVNLVYLPMAFVSGLWLPISLLPPLLRTIAPAWPSWHLLQLVHAASGQPVSGALVTHVFVLIGVTAAFLGLARRRLVRG